MVPRILRPLSYGTGGFLFLEVDNMTDFIFRNLSNCDKAVMKMNRGSYAFGEDGENII